VDGFINTMTGLGGVRDKRTLAKFQASTKLDDTALEDLYDGNDVVARICNIFPEEALRNGWELKIGDNPDLETDITARLQEIDVDSALLEAATWGRCFGGGVIYLGADDGQAPDLPLDESRVKSLNFLTVFSKPDLQIVTYYNDPFNAKYGKPETFRLVRNLVQGGMAKHTVMHESRLVLFEGVLTTRRARNDNGGWSNSVIQRVYETIRDFEAGFGGVSALLTDASQAVYGIKGLNEIIGSEGGSTALASRYEQIELARSICRALLIDADGETFERKTTSFAEIPDVLDRFMHRLSAAAQIPVTILMGMSPAGLNATGASDIRTFYDRIRSYQWRTIKPGLERITKLMLLSMGEEPDMWDIKFHSLYQPTDSESVWRRGLEYGHYGGSRAPTSDSGSGH
jgi:hypothetical protein